MRRKVPGRFLIAFGAVCVISVAALAGHLDAQLIPPLPPLPTPPPPTSQSPRHAPSPSSQPPQPSSASAVKFPFPCLPAESIRQHLHPYLRIYISGQLVALPDKIGVRANCLQPVRTEDTSGIIHVTSNAAQPYTLADFFSVWRATFPTVQIGGKAYPVEYTRTRLLGHPIDAQHTITLLVDEQPRSAGPTLPFTGANYCAALFRGSPCAPTAMKDAEPREVAEQYGAGHTVVLVYGEAGRIPETPPRFVVAAGRSVGPISVGMSLREAVAVLGTPTTANPSSGAQGGKAYGWGTTGFVLAVDANGVVSVVVSPIDPRYRLSQGLHVGSPVRDVEAHWGAPTRVVPMGKNGAAALLQYSSQGIGFAAVTNRQSQEYGMVFRAVVYAPSAALPPSRPQTSSAPPSGPPPSTAQPGPTQTAPPGQPTQQTPVPSAPPSVASVDPYLIVPAQGIGPIKLGASCLDLVALLGTPKSTKQAPGSRTRYRWYEYTELPDNTAQVGFKGVERTGGLAVDCTSSRSVDVVWVFRDPQYHTVEGLHTDMQESLVRKLMGEPFRIQRDATAGSHGLVYHAGITFWVGDEPRRNDYQKVFEILVFSPR